MIPRGKQTVERLSLVGAASMLERMTKRALEVMRLAKAEAQRLRHASIDTEHLLVGLVKQGESIAVEALKNLGVESGKLRAAAEKLLKPAPPEVKPPDDPELSVRSKRVLQLAWEEARQLGVSYIGTEHLILGLLREAEGKASGALHELGVDLERLRQEVRAQMGPVPSPAPSGAPSTARAAHELIVETEFAAAHRLREHQGKCEALHGHNWKVQVRLRSNVLDKLGMVMDFAEANKMLNAILGALDHHYLNEEVPRFGEVNPTTENLSKYIFEKLAEALPQHVKVAEVTVWESDRCGASYREE